MSPWDRPHFRWSSAPCRWAGRRRPRQQRPRVVSEGGRASQRLVLAPRGRRRSKSGRRGWPGTRRRRGVAVGEAALAAAAREEEGAARGAVVAAVVVATTVAPAAATAGPMLSGSREAVRTGACASAAGRWGRMSMDRAQSSMLAPSSGEVEGGVADDDAVAPLPVAVEDDAADDAAAPLPSPGWA